MHIADIPYQKVLVAYNFFRQIDQLAKIEIFSDEDLPTTVVSYFNSETGAAEIQSKEIVENIRSTFFTVNDLSGVGFTITAINQLSLHISTHLLFI